LPEAFLTGKHKALLKKQIIWGYIRDQPASAAVETNANDKATAAGKQAS
jgi:hypothetical protein